MKNERLVGMRFGKLIVLEDCGKRQGNSVLWRCRCDCGNEILLPGYRLTSGCVADCGCVPKKRESVADLTGRRFGRLTVTGPADPMYESKKSAWHCRCDCGNEVNVAAWSLLRGLTNSCGCLNTEQRAKMHEHMDYRNGTCAEMLTRACADTGRNKAGFRGLYFTENGTYRASITFQGKHYTLGYYDAFSDAVRARLDAEEVLHAGYLKALDRYEKKAGADPEWAEKNPFYYRVERERKGFRVETNA